MNTKYLRNNHNIFIQIFIDDDSDTPITYEIYKYDKNDIEPIKFLYRPYKWWAIDEWDEAEQDAVNYAMSKLIDYI